jgi:hypothetical protein
MINILFEIGKRFKQREETVHLAADLLDRYYLGKSPKPEITTRSASILQLTCILVSSKYEELDENITLIKDLVRYFTRILPTSVAPPTFEEVVECERELMVFFNWDLMIITPTILTKLIIANGVVFENESFGQVSTIDVAKRVSERCLTILEQIVRELP